jgi:uncharacterized protein (DUF58 family)
MTSWKMATAASALLLGLALFAGPTSQVLAEAPAPSAVLEVTAVTEASVGEEVPLTASLFTADGKPMANATVRFYVRSSFVGVEGDMEIGRATTDANGFATIPYRPGREGEVTIRAELAGDGQVTAIETSTPLTVSGSRQVYVESAGIQVPGLGVWVLIAVLTGVWSILFIVALLIFLIAREGAREEEPEWEKAARGRK